MTCRAIHAAAALAVLMLGTLAHAEPPRPPKRKDTTPPAVSLSVPGTATGTVPVTVMATDAGGVATVQLYIDGVPVSTGAGGTLAYNWDTTAASNGPHSVQGKATDPAGNVGSSAVATVMVSNTTVSAGSGGGSLVVTVPTGADSVANGTQFQLALNQAHCGDTIVLQAGAVYETATEPTTPWQGYPFRLTNKGACTGTDADYITVQSSNVGNLPAGARVTPAQVGSMATLVTGNNNAVIQVLADAHHYRFVGIEFSNTTAVAQKRDSAGNPGHTPQLVESYGDNIRHIVIDRSLLHPVEDTTNPGSNYRSASRAVAINGSEITIENSYVYGFCCWYTGTALIIDSEAVLMEIGPGPLHVINNFLEAWYNNIFTGGADPPTGNQATLLGATATQATFSQVPNLGVGDLVAFQMSGGGYQTGRVTAISGTMVSFVPQGPSGLTGVPAVPGNARWNGQLVSNIEVRGNTLHKRPEWWTTFGVGGQPCKSYFEVKLADGLVIDGNRFTGPLPMCNAIGITSRNQNGSAPWSTVRNVTITNNLFENAGYLTVQLLDNYHTSTEGSNVTIANNLWQAFAGLWILTDSGTGVTIAHNTVRNMPGPSGSILFCSGPQANVTVRDNVVNYSSYGFDGAAGCWPNLVTTHNVFIDNLSVGGLGSQFPNDHIALSDTAVGFSNLAGAELDYHGYGLSASSPYRNTASDGTDPGVNLSDLDHALGP